MNIKQQETVIIKQSDHLLSNCYVHDIVMFHTHYFNKFSQKPYILGTTSISTLLMRNMKPRDLKFS